MLGTRPNASDESGLRRNPSPFPRFQRRNRFGLAVAVAAALGAGCLERPIDTGAQKPADSKPPVSSEPEIVPVTEGDLCDLLGPELCKLSGSLTVRKAKDGPPVLLIVYKPEADEKPEPASVAAAPAGPDRPEIVYGELRSRGPRVSGDALLALDQKLKDAEEEFPLDFRFSYERATLVVFGKHRHHEAFRRLRRSAEKAIEIQKSDAMLEMLRRDAARNGPFWKLARGHREWKAIHEALEHRDRERLWHEPHPAEPVRRDSREAARHGDALDQLLVMRERIGMHGSDLDPELATESTAD